MKKVSWVLENGIILMLLSAYIFSVVIVEPSMEPMKVLRHYYFAAVNTIGDAIFIPSIYDLGCHVVVVKNPRSRPRQGLPLDRELTCHLCPSLCSLSLKPQSQP